MRSTITELRTTAIKPQTSKKHQRQQQQVCSALPRGPELTGAMFEGQKEVTKSLSARTCLLLLHWFTLWRVSSTRHNIMVPPVSITGERSYPSSVSANCYEGKGWKKDERNSYHRMQWKRQAGPSDMENFWQRGPRRRKWEENPVLQVVKSPQIHSLQSKNIKQP